MTSNGASDDSAGGFLAEGQLDTQFDRGAFLRLSGLAAGGLLLGGSLTAGGAAAIRRVGSATAGPLADKTVGVTTPFLVEVLNEIFENMEAQAKTPLAGEKIQIVNSNGDIVQQHADVSTFLEQKVDAVLLLLLQATGWDDTVAQGTKQGIGMFSHSASAVGGTTQNVGLDQYHAGWELGLIAANWINKKQGGKADVAVLPILNDPQLVLRGKGIEAALKQSAPGANIVGEVHAQLETEGAAAAASLLQANPKLKAILSAGDDPGLGAYTAATEAGKTDGSDFFIGSCDGTDAVLARIAEGGIYQATADFLYPFSATQLERDIEKFLRGKPVQPTRLVKPIGVSAGNLSSIQALSRNPRAAGVQWVYTRQMRYSNYRLKTNEPFADAFK